MGVFVMIWLVLFAALVVFSAFIGVKLRNSVWGIFIDARNTWSLSQFQLVIWTFAGIPLVLATALWRATDGDAASAWDFEIPNELLALMGISVASAVTSLAIKSSKDDRRSAFIAARPDGAVPPFADMFAVEEGSTGLRSLDVTKIQNFVLSVFLLLSYVWIVLEAFGDLAGVPGNLPAFSDSMVGLLAISHGGYLIGKVPNRDGLPGGADVSGATQESAAEAPSSGDIISVGALRATENARVISPEDVQQTPSPGATQEQTEQP